MTMNAAANDDADLTSSSRSKRTREPLIEVADFLNQFQSHFLSFPSTKNASITKTNGVGTSSATNLNLGEITPPDLQDALKFRFLLERYQILEQEKFVAEEYARNSEGIEFLTRRIAGQKAQEIDTIQKKINDIPDRTKSIHSMLRRCEVWTCKVVAQDHLVSPTSLLPETARNKTTQCCFSPLLNLPSSKYFANLLPPIILKDKNQVAGESEEVAADNTTSASSSIPAFHRKNNCAQCCSLALPPNKHTWEAYARLAMMASLIGDEDLVHGDNEENNPIPTSTFKNHKKLSMIQCLKSPSCVNDLNKHKKGKNPSHNQQYSFSPLSDFVPLWIRAQRNTQALRQLNLLFEVARKTRNKDDEIPPVPNRSNYLTDVASSRIDPENFSVLGASSLERGNHSVANITDTDDTTSEETFKATFRGNPLRMKMQLKEVSDYVDQLVEWAVVNQSIFTYHHIKKVKLTAPLRKQQHQAYGRKRQRIANANSDRADAKKRIRHDGNSEQNLFELYQACQSYILRWFARRNRKAVSILFSKRVQHLSLDIGCTMDKEVLSQAEVMKKAGVVSKIKEYMLQLPTGNIYHEDRTLSRIDRRLLIVGRYDGSTPITCQSQVSNLLETFLRACPKNQKSHKYLVTAAIEDLELLFRTFSPTPFDKVNQDDIYNTAFNLIGPAKGCTESYLIDLLKSAPQPWVETCCKCKKTESSDLRTCFNCEQVFHEKCATSASGSPSTSIDLKNLIRSFPPLHNIFKLKLPNHLERPDFLTSENEWVEKSIRVERKMKSDRNAKKLGISFIDTEECTEFFYALESNVLTLLELIALKEKKIGVNSLLIPARIARKGVLVTGVQQGLCGNKAGLQIGDVIISVELKKHLADKKRHEGPKRFDMSALSKENRVALLNDESTRMNLTILRPQINIVELATTWYAATKQENKKLFNILRKMNESEPWYCGTCSEPNTYDKSKSVFLEAAYCRAVIRRLGMECYSEPFREGNQEDKSSYFCLRRLDAIMTHIMRVESNDNSYDYAPKSFLTPPLVDSTCQQLSWATEPLTRQPMKILCEAMKTLINSSSFGTSDLNTNQSAFICHFIVTFCSWCVGPTVESRYFNRLAGPPDVFRFSRTPWLGASCSVCFSQPSENMLTCKNQVCVSYTRRNEQRVGNIDEAEIKQTGNAVKEYSMHASLVGTSFLVLPSDPLVAYVSTIVPIDSENRSIEFVVASYLPSDYHDAVVKGRQKDQFDQFGKNDGIYHLIPVVSSRQQLFLLERCKMRNEHQNNINSGFSWTSLHVLNLEGVARYSPAALEKKMKESNEIRRAIDDAIIRNVSKSPMDLSCFSLNFHKSSYSEIAMEVFSPRSEACILDMPSQLIDTLLKGKGSAALVRELLSTPTDENEMVLAENEEDLSNWKIIQRKEDSNALKFGPSCLLPGLIPINPIKTSYQVLTISHISENKYLPYYSDLLFQDEVGKQNLKENLYPSKISPFQGPRSSYIESKKRFILTQPDATETGMNMPGWGFEILRWGDERILRIGRVQRESLAFKVGLKTHDIIESINGVRFSHFRGISDMIASILGAPKIRIRMPQGLGRYDEISILFSTIKLAKIKLSPVALTVSRPSSISLRSKTPISQPVHGSATQTQRPHQHNIPSQSNKQSNHDINQNKATHKDPFQNRLLYHNARGNNQPYGSLHVNVRGSSQSAESLQTSARGSNQRSESLHTSVRGSNQPSESLYTSVLGSNQPSESLYTSVLGSNQPLGSLHANVRRNHQPSEILHTNVRGTNHLSGSLHANVQGNHQPSGSLHANIRGSNNTGRAVIMRNLQQVQSILSETYKKRKPLQKHDFYRPAKNGTIFTAIEVSVFLESFMKGTWKLGTRLLMPRYDPQTISVQIKTIISWSREIFLEIPVIQAFCYQEILELDFKRMNCREYPETGPIILREYKNGVNYEYREPIRPLPIDKCTEIKFDEQQIQQYGNQHYTSFDPRGWQAHQNEHNGHNIQNQHEGTYQSRPLEGDHRRHSAIQKSNSSSDQDRSSSTQDGRFGPPPRDCENQNYTMIVDLLVDQNEPRILCDEPNLPIHNLELNNISYPVTANPGQSPERIRGGGDATFGEPKDSTTDQQNKFLYLCDVPPTKWKGKAVYTFVQTASEGSICSDVQALLIGFVKRFIAVNSRDEESQHKVEFEAYYVSGAGYFENTKMHQSDSDQVWVVDIEQDSEESRVIAKLRSQNKLPDDYHEEDQRALLRSVFPPEEQKGEDHVPHQTLMHEQHEEKDQNPSRNGVSDDQQILDCLASRGEEGSIKDFSFTDTLRLDFDRTSYIYSCEEEPIGSRLAVKSTSAPHDCSLCSLPFERFLVCTAVRATGKDNHTKPSLLRTVGCDLMSGKTLDGQPSRLNENIPGLLGEGKTILLKIARLIPESVKISGESRNKEIDPLNSFRVFSSDLNYTIWKAFVAESTCTHMLAQAFVGLIASIQRSKLPDWWGHGNGGWSTPYAVMANISMSTLYLHIYVLDAALSHIISESLKAKTPLEPRSDDANAVQKLRLNNYWKRAMALGYKPFEGDNKEDCYHCDDGGILLCCELCPNVQHHECCDPKLSLDVVLDHWICDSCINDIDTFEEECEFDDE